MKDEYLCESCEYNKYFYNKEKRVDCSAGIHCWKIKAKKKTCLDYKLVDIRKDSENE